MNFTVSPGANKNGLSLVGNEEQGISLDECVDTVCKIRGSQVDGCDNQIQLLIAQELAQIVEIFLPIDDGNFWMLFRKTKQNPCCLFNADDG